MKRSWEARSKAASQVSPSEIDVIYETAMTNGAQVGKISGAGGGSFLNAADRSEIPLPLDQGSSGHRGERVPFDFVENGAELWKLPN